MSDLTALITAISLVVTAIGGFAAVFRGVRQVHTLVNSNNEAMVAEQKRLNDRVEQLIVALGAANVAIPDRPPKP